MVQQTHQDRRLTRLWRQAPSAWAAFFGALIFGLIAQGMGMFNKFSWHDDIHSLFLTGATITSGRWMLHVLGEAEIALFGDGHFSLPLMNGLFALLCIGASAGIIVHLLQIRSRGLSALLGGILAAFPAVTALFGFMFAVPYYFLALAMMVACAALICGEHPWWARLSGIILGGCSVGIYQAFLPLLPSLVLLSAMARLWDREEKNTLFFRHLLIQGICVLGVMLVYTAGSRFFLSRYGLELDSYMGISDVGSVSLGEYLQRALRAYGEFFHPSRNVIWDMYPQHAYYLYLLSLGVNALLSLALILKTWRQNRGRAALLLLLLALFPLGCNLVFVMSGEVHSLMVYGQTAHFMLLCLLADRLLRGGSRMQKPVRGIAMGVLAILLCMYVRFDNQCYLKIALQQQENISWNTALIAQIKSAPGFRDEYPIAWIGRREARDRTLYDVEELGWIGISGYSSDNQENLGSWTWQNFMERWCGFSMWEEDAQEVSSWPEVRAMPCYPEEGSIQVVRDVVVVKFAENEEEEDAP